MQALLIAERAALLSGRDEEFVQVVTMHYTGMRWGEVIGLQASEMSIRDPDLVAARRDQRRVRQAPAEAWVTTHARHRPFLQELLAAHLGAAEISDECTRSTVKNSLAVLVRVMEQVVRDGIVDRNPARIIGWQRAYRRAEDELDDPRALALPSWQALCDLADALVARSSDHFEGWGEVVIFAACTAARIGEVSGLRCADIDIDTSAWTWTVRRQTTPSRGGLIDKGTKGERARTVPLIQEVDR